MAKRAKTDPHVVYMGREHGPFKCGRCQYFSAPNGCEKVKGTIAPGMLADIAILATDVLARPPATREDVAVDATIFDGKVVYRR